MGANWIFYPGDFELMLYNREMSLRKERDVWQFPIWRMDYFNVSVKFAKKFVLSCDCEIFIKADGKFNIELDKPGNFVYDFKGKLHLPAGEHSLNISVYNSVGLPCLYVKSDELVSDNSWYVTRWDNEWLQADSQNFEDANRSPNTFKMSYIPKDCLVIMKDGMRIYDFQEEMMALISLEGNSKDGDLGKVYYGESIAEATDKQYCETYDCIDWKNGKFQSEIPRAFRYVTVDENVSLKRIYALKSYLPIKNKAKIHTDNELMNKIYEISEKTFHLCSREFFIDGIKRDRWVWSGDAYQSYLMNYYSFFDLDLIKRTTVALRGKDPICQHINTITDYSLFWVIGLYDYYKYTADKTFIHRIYSSMISMMEFLSQRENPEGMLDKKEGDWVFVDWGPSIDNEGILSYIQILYQKALLCAAKIAELENDRSRVDQYTQKAEALKEKINELFWREDKGAFVYSINGKQKDLLLKQPNIIAVFFDFATVEQTKKIAANVLMDEKIPPITTPYMRFYELSAMCKCGLHDIVYQEMLNYWGGMIKLGATSFWEYFDPKKSGEEHYAMYGRRYGKSLCHAWGATPLYLIGKWFFGLTPFSDGYGEYYLKPAIRLLYNSSGELPVGKGNLIFNITKSCIEIFCDKVSGFIELENSLQPDLVGLKYEKNESAIVIRLESGNKYCINFLNQEGKNEKK
ncbi:MAG: alpha-rhamnosidase [Bacillota bacterium]|nr:MAG: alpha-rhamnosidase [Bacillota bacterium]